jgi:hypothetical protein
LDRQIVHRAVELTALDFQDSRYKLLSLGILQQRLEALFEWRGVVTKVFNRETFAQQEFKAVGSAHHTQLLEPIESYISGYH